MAVTTGGKGAHRQVRRWMPVLAPLLVAGGMATAGSPRGAIAPAALAGVLAVTILAGRDVAGSVLRLVSQAEKLIVSVIATTAFVGLVLPGWAVAKATGRDPLRPRWSSHQWNPTTEVSSATTSLGAGATRCEKNRRNILHGIGVLAVILALDFCLGWIWGTSHRHQMTADAPAAVRRAQAQRAEGEMPRDPRIDSPAMANAPWREEYFDAIQRTPSGYWPFTESRPESFRSRYVNIDDWTRRSHRPVGDPADMPTIWFFGGSTAWGEGQRDGYTIASWVSRIAEADGRPVLVRNYGQRGWTLFQEMILFEQQLASQPKPDFAVFYDGANEITTQSLLNEAVPSHGWAYTYAQQLMGSTIATRLIHEPTDSDEGGASLWASYQEHSLLRKLARWLTREKAGADVAQGEPSQGDPGSAFTEGQQQGEGGAIFEYRMTPQDGTDAGRVYERGKHLTLSLGRRYDVATLLFWQPIAFDGEPQEHARAELSDTTIDISDSLRSHPEVFIDGGHTNEEGARIVAEQIWRHLGPQVRAWYE